MTRLGIVCALAAETQSLTRVRVDRGSVTEISPHTLLILAGMGSRRARFSSQRLLDRGANALVSWGSAAGLHAKLKPGHLILPRIVLNANQIKRSVNSEWQRKLCSALENKFMTHTESLIESPSVLMNSTEKRALYCQSGAIAADMESAAIAEVAYQAKIPFVAIRAISDSVDHGVPKQFIQATDEIGRIPWQTILTMIALRPWNWPTAIRLGWGFHAAMNTLKGIVDCIDHSLLFSSRT